MRFDLKRGGFVIEHFIPMPKTAQMEEMQTVEDMFENSLHDAIEEKTTEILEACFGSRASDSKADRA